jgi:alpha/beta superfamily hydrolase
MAVERATEPISSPAVIRTPMYFGAPAAPLFGWLHAPPLLGPRPHAAAVICPPLGQEYTNTHRTLRRFADALAAGGFATLRFDYAGTGDSGGEWDTSARVATWVANIHEAIQAVRDESGCDRVGLVGLRLGTLLATLAAREVDVDWLVLWAPHARGRVFVRELKALALTGAAPSNEGDTTIEAGGIIALPALQQDLAAIDLTAAPPRARRILLAERDDRPPDASLEAGWSHRGLDVTRWTLPGFADMVVAPHNAIVPSAAVQTIVDWIGDGPGTPPAPRHARRRQTPRASQCRLDGVYESTLRFGHGSLFGVVTEPAAHAETRLPAIVLSNAGSAHHVGPNALYVQLARALAGEGFRVLRFDLPGLGDSVLDDRDGEENVPYQPDGSRTIDCGISALANLCGARTFVVMGLCSGAHAAFHAAIDLPHRDIVEALLINPLTYAYRPGMPLDAPSDAHAGRWQRYRQSMTSLRGWRKLLRPETSVTAIARDVVTRAAFVLKDRLRPFASGGGASTDSPVARALEHLASRGQHVTIVCSQFDPGHDLLALEAGAVVRRLTKTQQLTLRTIDGANHTFDARAARHTLIQTIARHLTARYGGGTPPLRRETRAGNRGGR